MGLTRCYKTEVFYIYICSFFLQHFMLFLLVKPVKEARNLFPNHTPTGAGLPQFQV